MLNVRANMLMKSAVIVLDEFTDFPGSPAKGTLCFKDEILYMYCSLDGIDSWYPLTNRNSYHIHIQGGASTGWNISHSLGTKDLIIAVYDDSDVQQTPSNIIFTDNDQITLVFTQAIAGRAIIVSAADQYTVNINNMIEEVDGDIQFKNDLIPDTDNAYDIGSMASRVRDIYVSGGTIYVGGAEIKEDEIILNGDATGTQFGFRVARTGNDDALFYFDESEGNWKFGDASGVTTIGRSDGGADATFQLDMPNNGPILKNSAGVLQVRNPTDSDFGNLEVGDLTVRGTIVTHQTETIVFEDNILLLNSTQTGVPTEDAGFQVERGDETNASIVWDESEGKWTVGLAGSEKPVHTELDNIMPGIDATHNIGASNERYATIYGYAMDAAVVRADVVQVEDGPMLKNTGGVMQVRNSSDSDFGDLEVENLTVRGTTTTVESETVTFADNVLTLNSNVTGTPSENAGVEVERGTLNNVSVMWDEVNDKWTVNNDGTNHYEIFNAGENIIPAANETLFLGDPTHRFNIFHSKNIFGDEGQLERLTLTDDVGYVRLKVGADDQLLIRNSGDNGAGDLLAGNIAATYFTTGNFSNNTVVLNADYTGSSPSATCGFYVERGTLGSAGLVWDESQNRWFVNGGLMWAANYSNRPHTDNAYDLGTSSYRFRDVYAVDFIGEASSATYADLAEVYKVDRQHKVGTVVRASEDPRYDVQACDFALDTRVIGVISENPAYLMNREEEGLPVALTGKVPVRLVGPVKKSDVIVPAGEGCVRAMKDPSEMPFKMGCAVEENLDAGEKLVMCIIR